MTETQYFKLFSKGQIIKPKYFSHSCNIPESTAYDICDRMVAKGILKPVYFTCCPECKSFYDNERFYTKEELFKLGKEHICKKCGEIYDATDSDCRLELYEMVLSQ